MGTAAHDAAVYAIEGVQFFTNPSQCLLLLIAITTSTSYGISGSLHHQGVGSGGVGNGGRNCELAELTCRDGRCIPLDSYCNGRDDCGDGSDEPEHCTPCNRTYHGREGRTYKLNLPRPIEGRLPFLCHLTFTAGGNGHGELVQLLWDAFSVGRLDLTANEQFYTSCPEGSLQLAELGRPFTGGSWCGTGDERASYYSEASTVTASIRLFHAPSSVPFEFRLRYRFVARNEAVARLGAPELPIERGSPVPGTYCSRNFYECHKKQCRVQSPNYPGEYPRNASCLVTVRQKFVPTCKHAMISVKAGAGAATGINQILRGTSYYNVASGGKSYGTASTSSTTMTNTSASSSSRSSMTSMIANTSGGNSRNFSRLSVWQDCPDEKDRLIFRDGPRIEDSILLVYCGGPLPRITARGPAMLIEFRSSPLAIPLGSSPLKLELEIPVVYVDSDGLDYARGSQGCNFFVNETSKRHGILRSPQHTLPLGSVCTWNIRGSSGDRVWLYFSSYSQRDFTNDAEITTRRSNVTYNGKMKNWRGGGQSLEGSTNGCSVKMTLWDGPANSGTLVATICDDTPKLCAHAALRNATRTTRPCTEDESYLTVSSTLTLRMEAPMGTALRTVNFQARYEFISTVQGGESWGDGNCTRVWRKVRTGQITSPRDLRLYGRGGTSKLDCTYRIEAGPGERIRLTIHNVSVGDTTNCASEPDPHTARPRCIREFASRDGRLTLYEVPWRDVRLPRACLCDNSSHLPMSHISASRALELNFLVDRQLAQEDFETLYFYASFELVRAPECPRKQRVRGEGGELRFVAPPLSRPDIYCEGLPWLVEARDNRSLFVLTWGWLMPLEPPSTVATATSSSLLTNVGSTGVSSLSSTNQQQNPSDISNDPTTKCPTTNRVLLYSGWPAKLLKVVCPAEPGAREFTVHVFSEEWLGSHVDDGKWPGPPRSPALLLDFVARETGQAAASWLEISKSRSALHRQLRLPGSNDRSHSDNETISNGDCVHKCPELGACIAPSLWCDGRVHCPSGHDEANCGNGARLLGLLPPAVWLMVAGVAGIVTAFACLLAILVCRSKARAKRLLYDGTKTSSRPRRAPTEETLLGVAS